MEEFDIEADFEIERMVVDDLPELQDHLAVCWISSYQAIYGKAIVVQMIESLKSELGGLAPGLDEIVMVARYKHKIVGCIIKAVRRDVLYIWGLYVAPSFQRRGLGMALMRSALLDDVSIRSAEVRVERESEAARKFYEKLGFRFVTTEKLAILKDFKRTVLILVAQMDDLLQNL